MAKPLISDELWRLLEPIIPTPTRRKMHPGRKRLHPRACLTGIVFVLKTGIGWEHLPQEMNCGSGMTCWRRLRDWQAAGVWDKLHQTLLAHLHQAGQINWSRALVDSSSVRAVRGANSPGQAPWIAGNQAQNIM